MATVSPNELDRLLLPAPSRVRLALAPNVSEVRSALEQMAISPAGQFRIVSISYDRLPDLRSLIDDILDHLAHVALSLFPNWYGDAVRLAEIDASISAFDSIVADHLSQRALLKRGVSIPWLKAARNLCQLGKLPLPRDFAGTVHAAQLALAIDLCPLLVGLFLQDERPCSGALHGLARSSEWLARETGSRVVVVVPQALSSSTELDSINFEAVRLSTSQLPIGSPPKTESRVSVAPLIGQPHPLSHGEQLLAKRLAHDQMLAGLFQFNIRVATQNGNQYLVIWSISCG